MKRFIYAFLAVSLACLSFVSCQKDTDGISVDGDWHLVSTGDLDMADIDVYATFSGGAFVLYQKTGDMARFYRYEGTYSVAGDVLSGAYSDGSPLASSYRVSLGDDGETLEMTALNGSDELSTYERAAVPADVREVSVPALKSGSAPVPYL